LKDPNGLNYNGWGFTGTQIQHGKRISVVQLKPGDLVFYGRHGISHVAIYVGNGRVVSHGSESGPLLLSTYYRSDLQYAISYWR
jgi:cell wall-associated NlpC family hydrolase